MKKHILLSLCLLGLSHTASATSPCEVVLCMSKPGESECQSAEREFYSIVVFHHGRFSPSRTSQARKQYLNQCPGADPAFVGQIISQFGAIF